MLLLGVLFVSVCSTVQSVVMSRATGSGLILPKGPAGNFDDRRVSGPVVKYLPSKQKYYMWYYGQSHGFFEEKMGSDAVGFPAGYIGLAESIDCKHWDRVCGPLIGGAVFSPNHLDETAFDSLCVAVGDVRIKGNGKLEMLYFAGSNEATQGPFSPVPTRGLRMRIGRAHSVDGIHWQRELASILQEGDSEDFDSLFVAWPTLFPVENDKELNMLYHTLTLGPDKQMQFLVGKAESVDGGDTWHKKGKVELSGFGPQSSAGHCGRCVIKDPTGAHQWLMFIEGTNKQFRDSIGLYYSDDGDNWHTVCNHPILEPSDEISGNWDNQALGCPSVIVKDNCYYLFFVGAPKAIEEENSIMGIGLAISSSLDYNTCTWKKW